MNAKQKNHQVKTTEWAALIKKQSESNLTVKKWCDQNNYSIHTYNYWKHQLKEEAFSSIVPDIVPLAQPSFTSLLPNDLTLKSPISLDSCNSRDLRDSKTTETQSALISIEDIRIEIVPSVSDEVTLGVIKAVRHV